MIGICATRRVSLVAHLVSVGLVVGTTFIASSDPADAARSRVTKRPAATSGYSPPTSAIVVDVNSGRVLYEKDADGIRYPASITKVMTLYILFEELESGRMTLDTPLTVSAFAASQSPSKLGLRPGSTIRVEDAIKAIVTKSANDIAVAIAENVSGSESEFSERMTRKAKSLGMQQTQYRNASGLPNKGQLTSARDLATLGIAIQQRFPRYYTYFSTRVFNYAGRSIGNHNRLLGKVEGVDGIKTGFVNASGFNLATSVRRDGRHIVGIVMGGRTGPSRDNTMRELIALYLPQARIDNGEALVAAARSTGPAARAKPAVVADMFTPQAADKNTGTRYSASTTTPSSAGSRTPEAPAVQLKVAAVPKPAALAVRVAVAASPALAKIAPDRQDKAPTPPPVQLASVDDTSSLPAAAKSSQALSYATSEPALAPSLRWIVGARPVGSSGLARLIDPAPATRVPKRVEVASLDTGSSSNGEPALVYPSETTESIKAAAGNPAALAAEPAVNTPVRQGWFIQIGATPTLDKAQELLSRAKRATRVLNTAEPFTESVEKGFLTIYRARFAGLDKNSAQQACDALKRADINCFAIKN